MTTRTSIVLLMLAMCGSASAQQVMRPAAERSVTLSLGEYNRLIDLANRPPTGSPAAPNSAVVASADLRVRVDRDNARGVFTLAGDVLNAGVTRVGLLSGATLIDANAAGRPLPLIADGNALAALIPGPGQFGVSLEWGAPLTYRPGRASFMLPVPQAGSARSVIDLPGEQADVHLSAGLITKRTMSGGRTTIEATLDPGSNTEVWWTMRDASPAAVVRELRMLADVMTLVTLGDSDIRMVALIDVTVVQGELRTIAVRLPAGYEVTGISGNSLESSEPREDGAVLTVGDPAARSHQFLISLERPHEAGSFEFGTGLVSVRDVQRERGEIAVEGAGTMELTSPDREGVQRIDVRELNASLQSLSRLPLLSGFRYQRTTAPAPSLAMAVSRFADAGVLSAVADSATATTLVTSEGRALTEVSLRIQNRAQPFMKINLPSGATIVSVQLAGESAKPVLGADGVRIPLRRPGLPVGVAYDVSFVYLHAGTPFASKGEIEMSLPKMDVPIGIVNWEVFVPERYSARAVGGNAIDVRRLQTAVGSGANGGALDANYVRQGRIRMSISSDAFRNQIHGRATDVTGAVLPGVTVELRVGAYRQSKATAADGTFVMDGVPEGDVAISATLAGFRSGTAAFPFDGAPRQVDFELEVGSLSESVTVTAESPMVSTMGGTTVFSAPPPPAPMSSPRAVVMDREPVPASKNVVELQQRTAGVLPIRIDVPRTGISHRFAKPLVVDQETTVRLRYKRR